MIKKMHRQRMSYEILTPGVTRTKKQFIPCASSLRSRYRTTALVSISMRYSGINFASRRPPWLKISQHVSWKHRVQKRAAKYEAFLDRIKGLFEATTILHDEVHASV